MLPPSSPVLKYFQSTSYYLANSKLATLTTVPGGKAHAGLGSSEDTVRLVLFWTRSPPNTEGYDGDSQDTKVTAMIDIARMMWKKLDLCKRKEILHLVYLCLMMSYPNYLKNCHLNYTRLPLVAEFLKLVIAEPSHRVSTIRTYAKEDEFFMPSKGTH